MKLNQIKVGNRYETNLGHGTCEAVDDAPPRNVRINVDWPVPRGATRFRPCDVVGRASAKRVRP